MINSQRKKEIIEYLSDVDYRTLKEIAERFDISMNTVRRDINELINENKIRKFYGGVSLIRKQSSTYSSRAVKHHEQKNKIAQYAATLIKDNDLLFIDAGTTTSQVVDYIDRSYHLTFVTNNIHTISKIVEVDNENWNLIVVGSKLKHSSHSLIDVHDWDYLNSLNLNKAFIATTGLTIKSGATNPNNEDATIKSSMIKRSQESYLLLDSSKFEQTSLITFADIHDFDKIITAGEVPKYYKEYLDDNNIQLVIV